MCQAARSIINSACELEQEKTGRNRTVSVGFANHMQGDLLDPASLASRMFARIYLADLALALKASWSLYSRVISGCVPTWSRLGRDCSMWAWRSAGLVISESFSSGSHVTSINISMKLVSTVTLSLLQ